MKVSPEEIQKRFPFFEKSLVQEIVKEGSIKIVRKGEYLVRKGQYIRSSMLVLDGLVKVYRENVNGNKFFLHYLGGGDPCALSLLCASRQEASEITAMAFKSTTILAIPFSCMEKWMKLYKTWYQFVFDMFRYRFDEVLKIIDNLAFQNMEQRLIGYLNYQEEKLNTPHIPITRTAIAMELNSSREVVTRLLKKLAGQNRIRMHRHSIELMPLQQIPGITD